MDGTLETLNIQITADSRAAQGSISSLVTSLRNLDQQLGSFRNLGTFSGKMRTLADSVYSFSHAIDSIDITHIGSVASSMKIMASATNSLSRSANKLTFNQVNAEANTLSATERNLSNTTNGTAQAFANLSSQQGRVASIGQSMNANAFYNIADGLRQIETVNITNVGRITELSKAIRGLGSVSSEKAIANLPRLSSAMRNLLSTLASAPKVSGNVTKLVDSLAKFNNSMKVYNGTARSTKTTNSMLSTSFLNLNRGVSKANTGFKGLASTIGKIYATYWLFFRLFSKIGEAINLSSQLTEVENVVNQTFGDMRSKIDEFATVSINKFGMSELAMKQYASRFQAMGSAMDITGSMLKNTTSVLGDADNQYGKLTDSMSEMSLNLTKLTADMASFYDVEQSAVAEDLYSVFTGQTRSLRQYGIDLTNVNLKEWAMKKGLDANLDAMTQAQKAALRYAYTLDAAKYAMGDFERTSDTWANSVRILKANLQQLAIVIGQGFINALKPLLRGLNTALQAITSFATKVLNALGQIFGWKYEINLGGVTTELEDAAGYSDDLSDGLGGAANNAKELNRQLRGFDKLNVLTSNKDNGGGGKGSSASGGGGGKIDDSGLIKAAKTTSGLYHSLIKDLEGLGKYISNALSKAMESINWNDVYEKARNFGKGLADFMNGMFAGEAGKRYFENVGKTIAGALNTVGEAIYAWATEFKWAEFGENLASGLNKFFRTWKPVLLGSSFYRLANGILDAIISALDTVNWELVGTKIGQFLSSLKFEKIVKKMAVALGKAISGIFTMVKFSFKQAPIETAIITAFAAIKFTSLGAKLAKILVAKLFGKEGILTLTLSGIGVKLLSNAKILVGFGKNIILNAIAHALGCTAAAAGTMMMSVTILLAVDIVLQKIYENLHKSIADEIMGGEDWDILKEQIDNVSESVKDFTNSLGYMKQEYNDSLGLADQDAKDIQKLADRYFELAEKTELTAKEKEQLKTVAESLIGYIPELSDLYNEQTGYIDANKDAIKEMTDAYVESVKQAAKTEYLTSLYKKQYEAFGNMKTAWEDYQKSLEGYDEKVAELEQKINFYARSGGSQAYREQLDELNKTVNDARNSFYDAANGVNELGSEIYNLSGDDSVTAMNMVLEEGGKNANSMGAALKGLNTDMAKTSQATGEMKNNISSNLSGASSDFSNFRMFSSNELLSTQTSLNNTNGALMSFKDQTDMSVPNSNFSTFDAKTASSMAGVVKSMDNTTSSIDGTSKSTDNLMNRSGQTFTIKSALSDLINALSSVWSLIQNIFSKNGQTVTIYQNTVSSTRRNADGGMYRNGKWHDIAQYASGGLPSTGQMFIAREAGPELVGRIGGGTAVMNNDQIVASVSAGVYQAVASAMRQYGGSNVNVTLQGDAEELFRVVQTESNSYYGRTGRTPFPT